MTDRIELFGIRGYGYHGVLPEERRDGQEYVVDVAFEIDTRPAAGSDDLDQTVDYGAIAAAAHAIVTGPPVDLIETLADRIATACLTVERIEAVEVAVHKPRPPIASAPTDEVVVRIRRARG